MMAALAVLCKCVKNDQLSCCNVDSLTAISAVHLLNTVEVVYLQTGHLRLGVVVSPPSPEHQKVLCDL